MKEKIDDKNAAHLSNKYLTREQTKNGAAFHFQTNKKFFLNLLVFSGAYFTFSLKRKQKI